MKRGLCVLLLFWGGALCGIAQDVNTATIVFKDGTRLEGKVIKENDIEVTYQDVSGKLTKRFLRADIEQVVYPESDQAEQPQSLELRRCTLVFKDGARLQGKLVSENSFNVVYADDTGKITQTFSRDEIEEILFDEIAGSGGSEKLRRNDSVTVNRVEKEYVTQRQVDVLILNDNTTLLGEIVSDDGTYITFNDLSGKLKKKFRKADIKETTVTVVNERQFNALAGSRVLKKPKEKGSYGGYVELVPIAIGRDGGKMELTATLGYRVSRWFVGGGVGVSYTSNVNMSFYAATRYDLNPIKNLQPFVEMKIGGSILLGLDLGSPYFQFKGGMEWRRFFASVGLAVDGFIKSTYSDYRYYDQKICPPLFHLSLGYRF